MSRPPTSSPVGPASASASPDVDVTTPAVVLKLDPNVFHHGGLGVIRSLGRLGVPVYGVHEDALAPAANSRYLRGRWFWRPDPDDTGRLLEGLARLADHIGRRAVLIATDDAGAIFLAEHQDELRRWFLFPAPPADLPRRLAGKYSLFQLCRELGVPCAATSVPTSFAEAEDFAGAVGMPLVAKLTCPWRQHGSVALRSTVVVRDADELAERYAQVELAAGTDLMLQEHIPAARGDDWFLHGYCDRNSECRPVFTGVKDRSYPPHFGLTTFGRSSPNDRLRHDVARLLARLSYRGIMDLDIRRDARDGQYKILDFNPRIGAQFRLFEDAAGVDVVRAAHLDMTGRPIPYGTPATDRGFVVENYDLIAALGYRRDRELTFHAWVNSLRDVDETAWFARDDLAPFGLMCIRMCFRAATRPFVGRGRTSYGHPRYRPGRAAPRTTAAEGERNGTTVEQR